MPTPSLEFRVPRSTYSRKNGLQFKSVFDKCLREGRAVLVPLAGSGYTLLSLRQKLNDGLLWLMDNYEPGKGPVDGTDGYTKKDYERLKLFTKIRIKEDGVLIDYNTRILHAVVGNRTPKEILEEVSAWKSRLLGFLDNGAESKLFINNLNLAPTDIEWCKTILRGSGFEFSVDEHSIKVIK